jgi:hypothetical protein
MLWGHARSLSKDTKTKKLSDAGMAPAAAMKSKVQPVIDRALAKVIMSKTLPIVQPFFLLAKCSSVGTNAPPSDLLEAWPLALEQASNSAPTLGLAIHWTIYGTCAPITALVPGSVSSKLAGCHDSNLLHKMPISLP